MISLHFLKNLLLSRHKFVISGLISVLWMVFIYHTTVMIFSTNDDVGRAMRVHGYGYFSLGSPYILYSNVLWGWILYNLPQIGWMYAYYWMTIVVLVLITWAFIYYLWQIIPWYGAILVTLPIMTSAMVAPQFTINSGLLAVAMLLAVRNYRYSTNTSDLYVAIGLGILSLCIRERQFMLTTIIGFSFLPLRYLWFNQKSRQLLAIFFVICVSIISFDRIIHIMNPTYARINQLRSAYDPIEDYKALEYFKNNRQYIENSGYSFNDLLLMSRYFWFNSDFTNLDQLKALNQKIHPIEYIKMTAKYGTDDLFSLRDRLYIAFFLSIATIMLYTRSWRTLVAVVFIISMIWAFGASGRGSVTRVVLPLIIAIFVLSITELRKKTQTHILPHMIITMALIITISMHSLRVYTQTINQKEEYISNISDLADLDVKNIYAVGSAFPATSVFALNKYLPHYYNTPIIAFNLSVIEPYNFYYASQRDFAGELTSEQGVLLMARKSEYPFLEEYCWAHFQGILNVEDRYVGRAFTVRQARCTNSPLPHRNNRYLSYNDIP